MPGIGWTSDANRPRPPLGGTATGALVESCQDYVEELRPDLRSAMDARRTTAPRAAGVGAPRTASEGHELGAQDVVVAG